MTLLPTDSRGNVYKAVDRHARNAPPQAEQSIETLAEYLLKGVSKNEEKARAIFTWIADNISYDIDQTMTGESPSLSLDDPLKTRRTVCGGYSSLFERLASAMDLQAVTIEGFAKGFDYRVGQVFEGPPNHAWNAVSLDGGWELIDCTWGSGYIDDSHQFVKRFEDHFFLTPPEIFIKVHFPVETRWQLLKSPITLKEFEAFPLLKPSFFKYGIKALSHPGGVIRTDRPVTVKFSAPHYVMLVPRIMKEYETLNDSFAQSVRKRNTYSIRIYCPERPGNYILRVFTKPTSRPGEMDWAMDYLIRCVNPRPVAAQD